MPLGNIRVIKPRIGGGFGSKRELMACDFCAALLSRHAGRPVKIIYDREEEFISTRTRHPMSIRVKTGVKKDGTLVAREGTIIADGGAYNSRGPVILRMAGDELAGPYRVPNVKFTGCHVYTNNPVAGAFRGYGMLQGRFAVESQMDLLAQDLGLDPVDIRLRNAVGPGEVTSIGWHITSCGLVECVERVVEASGWRERRKSMPPNRGLGIACNDYNSGAKIFGYEDSSAAYVRLQDDGTVVLLTGTADIGQGSDTTLCLIVAEELGLPLECVRIISADTEIAPRDLGTYASRSTLVGGNAVKNAAADARRQLFQALSDRLEARSEDLVARDGHVFVKGSPKRGISFAQAAAHIMKERGVHIQGTGYFTAKVAATDGPAFNVAPTYTFGAQVADVEVDVETGQVKVHNFYAAHDCGFAINPLSLEGLVQGAVASGTGHTLWEDRQMDDGVMLNPSLLDYKIATALEAPANAEAAFVESIDPMGPYGAKGMSESPQVPVAPAIANAIHAAIGVRIKDLPITPEKILQALEQKRQRA